MYGQKDVHIRASTYINTHTRADTYVNTHARSRPYITHTHTSVNTHINGHEYIHKHIHGHKCIYKHTNTHKYINTHTYKQTHTLTHQIYIYKNLLTQADGNCIAGCAWAEHPASFLGASRGLRVAEPGLSCKEKKKENVIIYSYSWKVEEGSKGEGIACSYSRVKERVLISIICSLNSFFSVVPFIRTNIIIICRI